METTGGDLREYDVVVESFLATDLAYKISLHPKDDFGEVWEREYSNATVLNAGFDKLSIVGPEREQAWACLRAGGEFVARIKLSDEIAEEFGWRKRQSSSEMRSRYSAA